ncbi:MAG: DNA polymerase III subunit gamma/tau [Muribaculaceae bacterium]|nr:DNA polymerase III subunit gamma/tau [Muribaculaceae bacterium]
MENNYLVSARKYRPTTFASVVGQKALAATLKNAIATGRLAHAYLFCGSRGVGKTTCARIFAKAINCEHLTPDGDPCNECDSCRSFNENRSLNIIELDAASNNGVEDMRELVKQVLVPPTTGRYRVFIIDEVHMLTSAAFNAFLKTLEEPPSYVVFILATTEKQKIIPTILSRCQIYDFARITVPDIVDHLAYVAGQEGITAERQALGVIATKADGAMRDALSIFDQVAASSRGNITYASTIDTLNVLDDTYYKRLLEAFIKQDVGEALMIYKEIRDKGFDSQFLVNGLASFLRNLMLARDERTLGLLDTDDAHRKEMAEMAAQVTPEFYYMAMSLCNDADLHYREATNKTFLVELLLIKLCQLLSPSPIFSGNGEGHLTSLDPIPAMGAMQAPKTASVPPATPFTPATPRRSQAAAGAPQRPASQPLPSGSSQPQAVAPRVAPSAAAVKRGMQARGMKSISLQRSAYRQAQGDTPGVAQESQYPLQSAQARNEAFGIETIHKEWEKYMAEHPTEKVLVNTMRASRPMPGDGTRLKVRVENQVQHELMMQHRGELERRLRDAARNDMIELEVEVNAGEASPMTWNDREIYSKMLADHPGLKEFVEAYGLTLM